MVTASPVDHPPGGLPGWAREVLLYAAAALAALVIAFVLLGLGSADLHVPVTYDGDGLSESAQIKGTLETGWNLDNPLLGAPGALDMRDYPTPVNLELVLVKALSLFSSEYAVVLNLYLLLMYPLTLVCALWALRRLGVSWLSAFVASTLYAFLPYHVLRISMYGQIGLASYFLVPLLALVAIESVERPLLPLHKADREPGWWKPAAFAVIVCALTASNGVYYAFFGVIVLIGAGLFGSWRRRTWRPLLSVAMLALVIAVVGMVNVAPTILQQRLNGRNPEVAQRNSIESELWGLKIDQMLLPVQDHRYWRLFRIKRDYLANLTVWAPWAAHNENVSLGLLGSIGLLALLAWLVFVRRGRRVLGGVRDRQMERLSVINGFALLVATYAGLGAVIGIVLPEIRVYARMFVYVAFFCFAALALLLDRAGERPRRTPLGKVLFSAFLIALLVLGLLDQVPPKILPDYAATKLRWSSDARIIARIERTLPTGAMVFTLPYMPFPESPIPYPGHMNDYDHMRGYMHSSTLRWSYAAMRGRSTDLWQRGVAKLDTAGMIAALRAKGFKGIWLNRDGYTDDGASQVRMIQAELGIEPLTSADGKIVFFQL